MLPTRRLAVLLLIAPACGGAEADPGAVLCGRVDLLAPGALEAVEGGARAGREAWLTGWYGRESAPGAPSLLADERAALRVNTPSRLRARLGRAAAPRTFTASVRRARPQAGATPLVAEVFWEPAGGAPRSLARAELAAAGDAWEELRAEAPAEPGTLWLVARAAHPGLAAQPAGEVCWGAPALAPALPPPLPDLVIVTVDTLRADAPAAMPRLRAHFEGALWAPRAVAPSNWTLPSFASLWTGLPAGAHGAGRGRFAREPVAGAEPRGFTTLGPAPTFVEALHAAGWATAGFHQNPFLEDWTGLSRGFDRWTRLSDEPDALREPALAWWRSQAHRPRLLLLHWMTPHLPYGAEDEGDPLRALPWREFLAGDHAPAERAAFFALDENARAEVRRRHRAEAERLDLALDALLTELLAGARDPVLLFWSDHGEELWEEGSFEHGHSFAESVVRVPLGLRWPGREPARALDGALPAGHLGLHLLHRLAESDPAIARALARPAAALPPCGLTDGCPAGGRGARSSHPLYRSEDGGVEYGPDGSRARLPFTGAGSGGVAPALSPEVARRLAELGYADD